MDKELKLVIGSRIKQARNNAGKLQKDLSNLLGYESQSIISEIENGKKDIDASDLFKIAVFLRVDISYLYGVDEKPQIQLDSIKLDELKMIEDVRKFDETDKIIFNQLRERNDNKSKKILSFSS